MNTVLIVGERFGRRVHRRLRARSAITWFRYAPSALSLSAGAPGELGARSRGASLRRGWLRVAYRVEALLLRAVISSGVVLAVCCAAFGAIVLCPLRYPLGSIVQRGSRQRLRGSLCSWVVSLRRDLCGYFLSMFRYVSKALPCLRGKRRKVFQRPPDAAYGLISCVESVRLRFRVRIPALNARVLVRCARPSPIGGSKLARSHMGVARVRKG